MTPRQILTVGGNYVEGYEVMVVFQALLMLGNTVSATVIHGHPPASATLASWGLRWLRPRATPDAMSRAARRGEM